MLSKETAPVYLNLGRDSLVAQEALNQSYATRASQLLQYSGILLGFTLAIIEFGKGKLLEEYAWFFILQGIFFLGVGISSLLIVKPCNWHNLPAMEDVPKDSPDSHMPEIICEELGDLYKIAIAANDKILARKAEFLSKAVFFAAGQTALLAMLSILLALGPLLDRISLAFL